MSYLDTLHGRRQKARDDIDAYLVKADNEGRDLSDAENAAIGELDGEIRSLDERIKPLVELALRDESAASMQAEVDKAVAGRQTRGKDNPDVPESGGGDQLVTTQYRTAGEYLADWTAWKKSDDQAAKHRLYRAIQHQTTTDNPGLLPTPIVGPVTSLLNTTRPAINAASNRPMPPKGTNFLRPKITQHTTAGVQTTEKTALNSQKLLISSDNIHKGTYGGVLNISQQDIDWSEPSIWDIALTDLFGVVAQKSEQAFCENMTTQVTQTQTLAAGADSTAVLSALYDGAVKVFNGSGGRLPDTLYASIDMWAQLGKLVDKDGRPVFPYLNPQNANGQMSIDSLSANPLGVRLVVSPGFLAGTMLLGVAEMSEWYQNGPGQLSVTEPEVLGVQVAVYTYGAAYIPAPTAFVKFTTT